MTKTENFNLNKPEAGDPMRLADFNQNSDIIDAALGALGSKEHVVFGSFEGSGVGGQTLNLDFTPKFILIMSEFNNKGFLTMATATLGLYFNGESIALSSSRCVENGVYIAANSSNSNNGENYYVAIP